MYVCYIYIHIIIIIIIITISIIIIVIIIIITIWKSMFILVISILFSVIHCFTNQLQLTKPQRMMIFEGNKRGY